MPMAMEEDVGKGYCYARRESTLKHVLCGSNFLTHPTHCLLVSFYGGGLVWFPTAHVERPPPSMLLPSSLLLFP